MVKAWSDEDGGLPAQEVDVSDKELVEEIGRRPGPYLGLSYEEFVGAYRAGTLPDTGPVNELVILLRFVEDRPTAVPEAARGPCVPF